ncbi:hypothetical protein H074_13992 [Amycolatopsis decaplanina DSM 44594]|uniref:Uncharacterized protein n=1 Tax=Amycolatopsis decaplanina DSM 44594 TaxID=1284240 RepID=M2ZGX4_9PSEU|nr:hypothetical protein H074_13992 [Amycolatopsis decaplanina DSM 44594]
MHYRTDFEVEVHREDSIEMPAFNQRVITLSTRIIVSKAIFIPWRAVFAVLFYEHLFGTRGVQVFFDVQAGELYFTHVDT